MLSTHLICVLYPSYLCALSILSVCSPPILSYALSAHLLCVLSLSRFEFLFLVYVRASGQRFVRFSQSMDASNRSAPSSAHPG
ncbi:hypothetical protein PAPYR_4155 [Paratrimastix pyriformis]|uniref:Secreted protein n=1 Tax=Paratrimastix pyriformis TaxID=342808 RepID=A0ABQ8UKM6_9EUKA|nr:hypothetical protein PAPYR_4155 [Paratrimastix pyriformis]